MNLLSLLLQSLTTDSSVNALAKKTGLSKAALQKLLPLAIPLLIKFLTNNASSQSGATSLLSALTQHTSNRSLPEQIEEADTEDGSRILGHIFGSQSDAAISSLASQSGLSSTDVSTALSALAPSLLSGLTAATGTASSKPAVDLSDGFDLSDLMGMFSGLQASSQQTQTAASGGSLLSGLLGGSSAGFGGGLLGSLLGSSASQAAQDNSVNGNQLLSLLSALQ